MPTPDSVAVEIFIARLPADDTLSDSLWERIDEQLVPDHVRRELARNGFRAGVVGGAVPDELACVLRIKEASDKSPEKSADGAAGGCPDSSNPPDLADDRALVRQWRRLRAGSRAEIYVSDVYPTLPVLINDENGLNGRTFDQAQAVYVIRAIPKLRQQVTLEMTPELHYGPPKTRFAAGEGPYWRMDVARDREIFERLRIPVTLLPGQMLVLGCETASAGSLGYHFHRVEKPRGAGRRLVVVRLAQVPDEMDGT